jgi:hypothetical protein
MDAVPKEGTVFKSDREAKRMRTWEECGGVGRGRCEVASGERDEVERWEEK